MKNPVGIYIRFSPSLDISERDQIQALRDIADQHGWAVARVFIDRSSARKDHNRRPGEDALRAAIRNGEIQMVLIWSVCRIGRSLADLVSLMELCRASNVELFIHQQGMNTAEDKLCLFDLSQLLAAHLHQTRREKIIQGQIAARSLSVRFGRPPLPPNKLDAARRELNGGKSIREVARLVGISPTSVARLKNGMALAATQGSASAPS